jgi:hypothetical protein
MEDKKKKQVAANNISQNWKSIQKKISDKAEKKEKKEKKIDSRPLPEQIMDPLQRVFSGPTPILSIDCEMVDTEEGDAIARTSIVNYNGKVVYDKFARSENRITDFRTVASGVTPMF